MLYMNLNNKTFLFDLFKHYNILVSDTFCFVKFPEKTDAQDFVMKLLSHL